MESFSSGTAGTIRCFISQSIIDMTGITGTSETTVGETGYTTGAVDTVVQASAMLQEQLKQKCNGAFISKKKSSKYLFSQPSVYTSLFTPRTKNYSS